MDINNTFLMNTLCKKISCSGNKKELVDSIVNNNKDKISTIDNCDTLTLGNKEVSLFGNVSE